MPATITERSPAPTVIQDNIALAPKVPDLPGDLLKRFPSLAEWQEDIEKWWNRNYVALQTFASSVGGEVDDETPSDFDDLQAQFDAFTAEINNDVAVIANEQGAQAKKIVTVSAMAGVSTNIKVQTTAPVSPSTNDYWIDTSVITLPITYQWDGVSWIEVTTPISAAAVSEERTARVTADGFLEGKYTLTVVAGDVITGFNITSASGSGTNVSNVAWTADQFQIYSGTSKKTMFVADGVQNKVRMADVLTVDGATTSVYVRTAAGAGAYNDASTFWYVDATGKMSLKTKFLWDGSNLTIDGSGTFSGSITASSGTIGGWSIAATTLSSNNAILHSAGQLLLGTSNDIVILSATDATYRIWIGNVTSSSAAFRVTKAGVMTAIGGFFSGSGTSGDYVQIDGSGFRAGSNTAAGVVLINNNSGNPYINLRYNGNVYGSWAIQSTFSGAQFSDNSSHSVTIDGRGNPGVLIVGPAAIYGFFVSNDAYVGGTLDIANVLTFGGDTNLYRSAANTLKTDDAFIAAGQITSLSTLLMSPSQKLEFHVVGNLTYIDESNGLQLHGDGSHPIKIQGGYLNVESDVINIGSDCNLYRSAANTLKTDNLFKVGANTSIASGSLGGSFQMIGAGADSGTLFSLSHKIFLLIGETGAGCVSVTAGSRTLAFSDATYSLVLGSGGIQAVDAKFTGQALFADGSTSVPSISFTSDGDTGWRWNSSGDMRAVTNGSDRLVVRDAAIVCLVDLKLSNAYVAGAPTATGYVTVLDSAGATYKVLVGT